MAEEQKVKPTVKLVGEDGNVFNIVDRVAKALRKAGMEKEAKEFTKKAFASESYDAVLRLASRTTRCSGWRWNTRR